MSHVIVVGGGAAGMFAAIAAAKNGHQVTLYEKNEKLETISIFAGRCSGARTVGIISADRAYYAGCSSFQR